MARMQKKLYWSPVTCHLSPVTCDLSLMPKATDPHPASSPIMHSRVVFKDHVFTQKIFLKKGIIRFPILAIHYLTSSLGSNCQWRGHYTYGNIANSTLNRFGGQFSENDGGGYNFFLTRGSKILCIFLL